MDSNQHDLQNHHGLPGGVFERKVSAHAERILSTFSCGFRVI